MLAKVIQQGVALLGQAALALDQAGLFAAVVATAIVVEQRAGHVAITRRAGRPADQQILGQGWRRLRRALGQRADERARDTAREEKLVLPATCHDEPRPTMLAVACAVVAVSRSVRRSTRRSPPAPGPPP